MEDLLPIIIAMLVAYLLRDVWRGRYGIYCRG